MSRDAFALFNIDTQVYMGELFDKVIAPTIQDPNPITHSLRTHFYRLLAINLTQHSLASRATPPSAPEMLSTFIDALSSLGLISL